MLERLQKLLAQAGIASRRKCEELIVTGQVEVNGVPVTTLGAKADPNEDVITVNGKPIETEAKLYIMLNKPKGVITSATDPQGRKVVTDFLKGIEQRVYPIGRLDYDTEGLLLLTNDGEFANLLTHPKHHVPKTYLASVEGVPHGDKLDLLRKGIELEDGMTSPAEVEYQDVDPEDKESTIRITIYEGRNRQVRRMFEAIGHTVIRLKRVKFGELGLQNLKRGGWRPLKPQEISELRAEAAKAQGKSAFVPSGKPAQKPEWKPKPKPKSLEAGGEMPSEGYKGGYKRGGAAGKGAVAGARKPANAKPSSKPRPSGSRSRKSYAEAMLEKALGDQAKAGGRYGQSGGASASGRNPRGAAPAKGGSGMRTSAGRNGAASGGRSGASAAASQPGGRKGERPTGRPNGR